MISIWIASLRVIFANFVIALFQSGDNRLVSIGRTLLILRFPVNRAKRKILKSQGWHRNRAGGYTHPYDMGMLHRWEITAMTPDRLQHTMRHGMDIP